MPRFHCDNPLISGLEYDLPAGAARHVQVLRMQPGDTVTLFNGGAAFMENRAAGPQSAAQAVHPSIGGEFDATITQMGRSNVRVMVGSHRAVECEAARAVHLVVGMPANERMDWLVEKATELGVASIQPVTTARTVLRLKGERADKKRAHWQAVAIAACEQCGRNQVPVVHSLLDFADWVRAQTMQTASPAPTLGTAPISAAHMPAGIRLVLSLRQGTRALQETVPASQSAHMARTTASAGISASMSPEASIPVPISTSASALELTSAPVWALHGPEGGLTPQEEDVALALGYLPVTLGPRVLRAETAALALLAGLVALAT